MTQTIDSRGNQAPAPERWTSALAQVLAGWNRAAATWDVDALTAMYTEDVLMYGGRPWHSVGHAGLRDYFQSYAGMMKTCHLELTEQTIIELAPDTLLAQGLGLFRFGLADGRSTGATMRTTWVLAGWQERPLIRQHHFSNIPDKPPTE